LNKEIEICRAEDYGPDPHAEGQPIRLPSGKMFLLRYPRLAFRLDRVLVSQSVAAMLQGGESPAEQSPIAEPVPKEKSVEVVSAYYEVLCEVCVRPKVSLTPGEGELHPDRITLDDALFIVRWAGGEVDANGNDLSTFRAKKPQTDASSSAGGENVRTVAERPIGDVAVETAV
jgi:hypothetical protein